MPSKPLRGRPPGLLMNPKAALAILGDRPQSWWAIQSGVSQAHLSEMLSGVKGANAEIVERLAAALDVDPGAIFPELVEFRTQVRIFVASAVA